MAPILYGAELSPPVRAVLMTARAIGLDLTFETVNLLEREHLKPEFAKLNPQHTVPTLDDDGFLIWDSHAINAYLVGKYAKDDSLYPKDLKKRAIVDQRLHFDSGILFPRSRNIFFPIFFLGAKEILPERIEAVHQAYAFVDTFLEGKDYFAGKDLTIADFSAISSISSVSTMVPFESGKYPNLLRWIKTMEKLPHYEKDNGNGAKALGKLAKETMEK